MKKLLITLGTIGTIVAPVATVVACGSSDSKNPTTFADKEAFKAYAKNEGFDLSSFDLPISFETPLTNAEVIKDAAGALEASKDVNGNYGSNDHFILIKGAPAASTAANAPRNVEEVYTPNAATTEFKDESILTRWNLTQADFGNSSFAIVLQQSKATPSIKTIDLLRVVKSTTDGKFAIEVVYSSNIPAGTTATPANQTAVKNN